MSFKKITLPATPVENQNQPYKGVLLASLRLSCIIKKSNLYGPLTQFGKSFSFTEKKLSRLSF